MKVTQALILEAADGYQAFYINGKLTEQAEELGEGKHMLYLLQMAEKYGFTSKQVSFKNLTDKDEKFLEESSMFPDDLSEFSGKY